MTDDRAVRALTDVVAVEEEAPGLARVVTFGDEYHVDMRDGGCNCPDKRHNEVLWCKHEYAALISDVEMLPNPYVGQIDARPALADGGDAEACESCDELPGAWPCADCYTDPDTEVPLGPYA